MAVKLFSLLWGTSGSAKTSLLNTFALGLHEATGKRVRLYTAESAQIGPLRPAIAAGIVDVWPIDNAEFPFERIHDATQGAWPEDPDDPKARPQPLWHTRHIGKCSHCNKVSYDSETAPKVPINTCIGCKQPITVRVVRALNEKNGWEAKKIGAVFYEGMTAFGELMMDNMSMRSARGEKMGEDVAVRFRDGALDIAGSSRSSFGIAQRQVKNTVQEARALPTPYALWTATKEQGEDDFKRVMICGPKLPGSAATPDVPRWFGPCLGTVAVPTPSGIEYRVYTKSYYETWAALESMRKIEHICNSRIPPAQLNGFPDYFTFKPDDKTLLWRVLSEIERRQDAATQEKK